MFLDSNSHNIKKDFRLLYVAMFCLSFSRNCEREKFFWASVYHMINREGVITCLESCTQRLYSSACPEKTCSCLTGGKKTLFKGQIQGRMIIPFPMTNKSKVPVRLVAHFGVAWVVNYDFLELFPSLKL